MDPIRQGRRKLGKCRLCIQECTVQRIEDENNDNSTTRSHS